MKMKNTTSLTSLNLNYHDWLNSNNSSAHSIILTCTFDSCHHYEASIASPQCRSFETSPPFLILHTCILSTCHSYCEVHR